MALPAATTWEVRPTVGADTNGGGFVTGASGTDYSQQNAKNNTGNNISTTDAVGVGTTTLTSATGNFSSAIVGNVIYLSGTGATTGWYEVTAFTNSTTVTLDRSPGTGTGWTMNIGGALATISQAYTNSTAGNTCYVKASGSYTVTTALSLTLNNTGNGAPYQFIGYTTTRGDNGQVTWTTATNSISLIVSGSGNPDNHVFFNFSFTTSAGTVGPCMDGGATSFPVGIRFSNCIFNGFTSAIKLAFLNGVNWDCPMMVIDNCEIKNCTSYGVGTSGECLIIDCYIHANTGDGVHCTSTSSSGNRGPVSIIRSVIYDNGGYGVYVTNSGQITNGPQLNMHNSAVVDNTLDGIRFDHSSAEFHQITNSIIESNGGYGIKNNNTIGMLVTYNNAYRNNTSGNFNGTGIATGPGDVTLTGEPFNTVGSDWTLNNTSGAGAACRGAGWPTSIP